MPVKFDDLKKTANGLLSDDYQTSGFQLKTKQKTSYQGAVVSSQVDVFDGDKKATGAKITWKLPGAGVGLKGLNIDKFEVDKKGGLKLETALDKDLHKVDGLKVELKSDLSAKHTAGITFSGIKGLQVIGELNPQDPKKAVVELTKDFGDITAGVKVKADKPQEPELGVKAVGGPCFAALIVKPPGIIDAFYHHKINKEIALALHASKGKDGIDGKAAISYKVTDAATAKVKVEKSGAVSGSVKYELAKGFSVLCGGKYAQKSGISYGVQLSVE